MQNLNWSAIGAIGTFIGIIVAIVIAKIQGRKKEVTTNDNSINQNIKGIFFSKNNISQKIEKKD